MVSAMLPSNACTISGNPAAIDEQPDGDLRLQPPGIFGIYPQAPVDRGPQKGLMCKLLVDTIFACRHDLCAILFCLAKYLVTRRRDATLNRDRSPNGLNP